MAKELSSQGRLRSSIIPRATRGEEGYSLIEMVVGFFIFSIILLVAAGAIITISRHQRTLIKDQEVIDTVRGAAEIINRALRVSYDYNLITSSTLEVAHPAKEGALGCPATLPCFVRYAWIDTDGDAVPDAIGEQNQLDSEYTPLTSPYVNVRKLEFIVTGAGPTDLVQAHVLMYMEVSAKTGSSANEVIAVQTTLTQRVLDFP